MAGVLTIAKGLLTTGLECPSCRQENVRQRHRKGYWEEKVLPLVGVWPYSCRDCRSRFYRFSQGAEAPKKAVPRRKRGDGRGSVQPVNQQEFEELISQIAEAERVLFGTVEKEAVLAPERKKRTGVLDYPVSK